MHWIVQEGFNAAGFYAGNVQKIVEEIENL